MVLLGTDVPDELSEVAEKCCGTSPISSTIISLGGASSAWAERENSFVLVVFPLAIHAAIQEYITHIFGNV